MVSIKETKSKYNQYESSRSTPNSRSRNNVLHITQADNKRGTRKKVNNKKKIIIVDKLLSCEVVKLQILSCEEIRVNSESAGSTSPGSSKAAMRGGR